MNKTLKYLSKIKELAEKEGLAIQITILNQNNDIEETLISHHTKCVFSQSGESIFLKSLL